MENSKSYHLILPQQKVLNSVLRLTQDPKTSFLRLAIEIQKDPSLLSQVFFLANTPLFGLTKNISDVNQAVKMLDFGRVTDTINELLKNDQFIQEKQLKYLQHSLLTAKLAKQIAIENHLEKYEEVYMAGLEHVCYLLIDDSWNLEIMSTNEASVFVLELFNFPEFLIKMIRHMREPDKNTSAPVLTSVLNIASYISSELLNLKEDWCITEPSIIFNLSHLNIEKFKEYGKNLLTTVDFTNLLEKEESLL